MNVKMKYGEKEVSFDIEGASKIEYLYENEMPHIEDIEKTFYRAVEEDVIGDKPLKELVAPEDMITIVISDLTRFWMKQDIITELLVKYLENLGVKDENIVVLVALGTHREQTQDELEKLASPYVYSKVKVVNHDCDANDLVTLGTTSRGTVVEVNPLVVGRKVIIVGGTVHHLMAGYGGGRKSILPGICSRETISKNHSMALSPVLPKSNDLIGSGKLAMNPIHEDMDEAAEMVKPIFGINIVVNSKRKHSGIFCGDFMKAWLESCKFCQKYYGVPIKHEADIVIVSCGGYPKDINLYQGVKTLTNAINALKKGGIC
ncbi:MAG: nickel-dependent lactate racemase, partial [Bacillota bacterium]|nr:nickel-dependent lactate racemase [Bacillota bacterium]